MAASRDKGRPAVRRLRAAVQWGVVALTVWGGVDLYRFATALEQGRAPGFVKPLAGGFLPIGRSMSFALGSDRLCRQRPPRGWRSSRRRWRSRCSSRRVSAADLPGRDAVGPALGDRRFAGRPGGRPANSTRRCDPSSTDAAGLLPDHSAEDAGAGHRPGSRPTIGRSPT
jgi:hypothetical protein